PWPLLTVVVLTLVLSETTVMEAPGIRAPCASVTLPPRVARTSCASPRFAPRPKNAAKANEKDPNLSNCNSLSSFCLIEYLPAGPITRGLREGAGLTSSNWRPTRTTRDRLPRPAPLGAKAVWEWPGSHELANFGSHLLSYGKRFRRKV